MDLHFVLRGLAAVAAVIGLAGCAGLSGERAAQAEAEPQGAPVVVQADQDEAAQPDATPVQPPQDKVAIGPAAPEGPSAELQRLIRERAVKELRTSYNGSFGASLLFKPDDLTYYAAMFRQKEFWQVIKTKSATQAEQAYRRFVARSAELADVEIRRTRLQAEQARTEQLLAERANELTALQSDLNRQREQAAAIAAAQRQAQQEAQALAEQQEKARAELRRLQEQIRALERQRDALGAGPAPSKAKRTLPPK